MTYRLLDEDLPETSSTTGQPSASISGDLTPLLAPASLITARDILRDRTLIPDVAGIYGWWFDTPLPGVPLDGTLAIGQHRLLYVGIAPRKPSEAGSASRSTLRRRIARNHLGNRIGSSTLRRSLAALLREDLALTIVPKGKKQTMTREDETRLTGWIAAHAAVSILSHASAWEIEDRIIGSGAPSVPLNLKGASHEFAVTLAGKRRG